MNSHRLTALALTALPLVFAAGCVGAPEAAEDVASESTEALATPTCVTIQRGTNGAVADTKLRGDQPNVNFGALNTFVTGDQFSNRISLLRFDLGSIPAGQDIVSADVTLHEISNLGASTVEVRDVTAPWSEGTVTWASFGASYSSSAAATFSNGGAGYMGAVRFDLTDLTRSQYAGTNNGMALVAPSNSTWASSEASSVAERPQLDVCYRPSIPAVLQSAFVVASDGGGWLTYSTSICGVFHLYVLDSTDPQNGTIVNDADGSLNLTLADGTHTYGVLGTDGNGPGATQQIILDIGGTQFVLDENGSTQTAVVGTKTVTVSNFHFTIPSDAGYSAVDRVAVCGVFPDGFVDSYGQFTVTVTPAP